MQPTFLTLAEVLELHQDQLNLYGGSAGIRDMGLLESALAMPRASYGGEFLHEGLHEMGAAYLYHIVQNHPFVDGNKRVGLAALFSFLYVNGIKLTADEEALHDMVLSVASGKADKTAIAEFLQRNSG